jgi:pilus assembly protein FimV
LQQSFAWLGNHGSSTVWTSVQQAGENNMMRSLAAIVTAALFILSRPAMGLGLGDIELRSALNEPMNAEIALLSPSADEIGSLQVSLASAATFERYGLDRPSFLSSLRFSVDDSGASPVIRITSTQAIAEPFVTILVEAVWPRGRLLREYTVLLDPPVFAAPEASRPAPAPRAAAAPAPRRETSSGTIQRAPARTAAPAVTPRSIPTGGTYTVRRNDTLWEIAAQVRPDPSITMNQMMVALYEANPGAFGGNINLLNAGASLQIPTAESLRSINRSAALAEVRRQNQDWRSGTPGSLRLVPPDSGAGSVGSARDTTPASGSGQTTAGNAELERVRSELAEKDRLLTLRNEEIARLRARLSELQSGEQADAVQEQLDAIADTVAAETDTAAAAAEAPEQAAGADEVFADDGEDVTAADTAEEAGEEADTAAETEAPVQRPTAVVRTQPVQEPSLFEKVKGSIWTYVGLGLAAVFAVLALFARRRAADNEPTGTWESLDPKALSEDADGTIAATGRLRQLADDDGESIVVVENKETPDTADTGVFKGPAAQDSADMADTGVMEAPEFEVEDTFSSETAINLDQADPVAEADFHMAYGLYDQAADLVKNALTADPDNNSLKAKLCEIYFVWGNQEGFIDAASSLRSALSDGDPEWDKIVIMGQQIAPAHDMFSGQTASAGSGDLDLSLDGDTGFGKLDVDLGGDGDEDPFNAAFDSTDIGETVDETSDTADSGSIDFRLDDFADDTLEQPLSAEALEDDTVEQPSAMDDLTATSEMLRGTADNFADRTAEIELDDLGLDLDDLDDIDTAGETGTAQMPSSDGALDDDLLSATGQTAVLPDDMRVNLPGVDDTQASTATSIMEGQEEDDDAFTMTSQLPKLEEVDISDSLADTGSSPGLTGSDVDIELTGLTEEMPAAEVDDLDLTSELRVPRDDDATAEMLFGTDDDQTAEQPMLDTSATQFSDALFGGGNEPDTGLNLELEDSGARTMTEVGTKLDLARAYIDMGDPDGARSILDEVLNEGDDGQKQEAQRLLDGLKA